MDQIENLIKEIAKKNNYQFYYKELDYLIKLLMNFTYSDSFHGQGSYLFELLLKAKDSESIFQKKHLYQKLGDVALFNVGFFPLKVEKSILNASYYLGLGKMAYQQVPSNKGFKELSNRFEDLVFILNYFNAEVNKTNENIIKLYEIKDNYPGLKQYFIHQNYS